MNELSPEKKKQLDSWASQRDAILVDISNKKTENEKLTIANRELANSNTDISNTIQQSIGRLTELDAREKDRTKFISIENADLIVQKSMLQTEIPSLKSEIVSLTDKKNHLIDDISNLTKVHETIFSRASEIERIISETVKINSSNSSYIKNMLVEAAIELKNVIDIGRENVAVTNKAISEIPKMIVDIHKDIIERKKISRHKI